MCCLGTAKWGLDKGSVLGWVLLLRFIFLIYENFLQFVVCCIFNGKKKQKIDKKLFQHFFPLVYSPER